MGAIDLAMTVWPEGLYGRSTTTTAPSWASSLTMIFGS